MKNKYCRTWREFSWSDFKKDGRGCCWSVAKGFKDNVMPTDNANNCIAYSFNKYWQEYRLDIELDQKYPK